MVVKHKKVNITNFTYYVFILEAENFIVLYLLPHIIRPRRCGKRKQADKDSQEKLQKLSLEERRESFILHVEVRIKVTLNKDLCFFINYLNVRSAYSFLTIFLCNHTNWNK